MLRGLLLLVLFFLAGDGLARLLHLPLPGAVLGMLLLAGALRTGVVKEAQVDEAAAALAKHLGLLFVPAGLGILRYGGLLKTEGVAIAVASAVSALLVLAVVALVARALERP